MRSRYSGLQSSRRRDHILVNPHAEGIGRDDDRYVARDERVLDALLVGWIQSGVEVLAVPCSRSEPRCEFFRPLPAGGVDDRRTARHYT